MALDRVHLRKLLKILFLDQRARRSALRADIREEIAKASGLESSGGDFYVPFWSDCRDHVFGGTDLNSSVAARIVANERRLNLYPRLRDGFLKWWNERRRWTNEPFARGRHLKARYEIPSLGAIVKIDSILSVTDATGTERAIYPYFAPEPALSDDAARLGLWLLTVALPNIPKDEFRILDVIRGKTFSLDRVPLRGDEEISFKKRYAQLLRERMALRAE